MSEAADTTDRWERRRDSTPSRWYTVEYDANSVAWLVADDKERVCLEHGMQLDITQLAWQRSVPLEAPPRRRSTRKQRPS